MYMNYALFLRREEIHSNTAMLIITVHWRLIQGWMGGGSFIQFQRTGSSALILTYGSATLSIYIYIYIYPHPHSKILNNKVTKASFAGKICFLLGLYRISGLYCSGPDNLHRIPLSENAPDYIRVQNNPVLVWHKNARSLEAYFLLTIISNKLVITYLFIQYE